MDSLNLSLGLAHTGMGLLLALLGLPLWRGWVPPHAWFGLRPGATLEHRRVWDEAHRRMGLRLMAVGGLLAGLGGVAFLLPLRESLALTLAVALAPVSLLTALALDGVRYAGRLIRELARGEKGGEEP